MTISRATSPRNHFTVGVNDDVSHTSLDPDSKFDLEGRLGSAALFYGLGSDGTVGANKNSIKIIGENTDNFAQGYFVYDSKKAGAITVSHVRFGKDLIRKPYLIKTGQFVACHNFSFLEKYDMLGKLVEGGTFLLNSPVRPGRGLGQDARRGAAADHRQESRVLRDRRHRAGQGVGSRRAYQHDHADGVLPTSPVSFPKDKAIEAIKDAIKKTYGKKGEKVVAR